MSKYQNLKVKVEMVDLLKHCQKPGETLSETLKALLDPMRVFERVQEARAQVGQAERKGG